ncbi:hypothetical protein [Deinococcus maricopensis]|uniref:Outer membrane protein beta-barrel domain-containing protein n=1 Tax=Deinococcus maricopensis (strain DSM 21211 / LMG 22137 / NRRL B-23946 / LB-34) TaxID=709986 RepID=E8U398_DEIML|nr:hypothetical protein [Deinococcus maricopensis]ADV66043.1 hypothetical protein Deima_0383 [Deinococcus maricopensis DSM 21211]
MKRTLSLLALLACGAASAAPLDLGFSVGIPRAGLVPLDLSATAPLFTTGDLTMWARADVTFAAGASLVPAFGATLIAQPAESYGAYRPFVGVGATTISASTGTQIRPTVLLGVQTRLNRPGLEGLGARFDTAMVFMNGGPRFNAALGLTYRLPLGGHQ